MALVKRKKTDASSSSSKAGFRTLVDFENQRSVYYSEGHRAYRMHVRKFVSEHLTPFVDRWEKSETVPREFFITLANYGGVWMFPWALNGVDTWNGYQWDPFYAIVFAQEWVKAGCWTGAVHIHNMAIPALIYYGKAAIHKQAVNELAKGESIISLAISELRGGSDVAGIETTAELTEDGRNYLVNGNKYWITAGNRAQWFVTLVRVKRNKLNLGGLTVLLIPRVDGHVFTSKIPVQGNPCSETAQVTFRDVRVPVENVVGEVGGGFKIIMYGFNNERFIIAAGAVAACIECVNESIKWAKERKTFGTPLIKKQVIRHKIAEMSRQTLATHALLEKVAYQMKFDRLGRKDKSIARNVALLKVQSSKTMQFCAIEASQIFGGRSFVRFGRAGPVERVYRSVRSIAIAGGSEEIMLDLAMRQAKL